VTGEETLAARWKDAPVLTIQRIQVVNPPDDLKQVKTN